MQKLRERNTYTPTVIPQDRSNCGLSLNSPEGRDSVAGLKTSFNNSDADLTLKGGQNLRVSDKVYVLNEKGMPLMPCSPQKARVLLKQGKAHVVKRTPFTIQLDYATGEANQPVALDVDSGYVYVGISAVTGKEELFSAEVQLRTDISKPLIEKRTTYRRNRRSRLWHRKARFLNRKKPEGWLTPSIQNKLDAHIKVINRVKAILPVSQINIEVAAFDIQKIKNPDIKGTDYQNGEQKGFWNTREYVLYRDGHVCQACNGKSKDKILNVHHIIPRKDGGADKSDNLITLCETCHQKYHRRKIKLKIKPSKEFKAETFMSTVRWKLVDNLRESGNIVNVTYGYITKSNRIALGLDKSHINDAFAMAGGNNQTRSNVQYFIKQVRKCNRSLFKANLLKGGKRKVNTIREAFGFHRFDKVMYKGIECFIYALRTRGLFTLKKLDGTVIHTDAKAKDCLLLESAKTILIERRIQLTSPLIEAGVPAV